MGNGFLEGMTKAIGPYPLVEAMQLSNIKLNVDWAPQMTPEDPMQKICQLCLN